MADYDLRSEILRCHGANQEQVHELLEHTNNRFRPALLPESFPIADEGFVASWEQYEREARICGVAATLQQHLIQLRFPIDSNVCETDAYLAAVRLGRFPDTGTIDGGVRFRNPAGMRLFLHPTAAGRIPVIVAEERADFIALVRALTRRNRPDPIPDSVGAMIVGGYLNWSRAEALRARGEDIKLHRNRFILLSTGPYSGVDASAAGLPIDVWLDNSLKIRLEHECAHYFMRRIFGHMSNSLHDEIIADFIGITSALGHFRADLLLRFMGVERYPEIRANGRLHYYRGTPPLSAGSFAVLAALLVSAARNLEQWQAEVSAWEQLETRARAIGALCTLSLEELAAADAAERIGSIHQHCL